MLSGATCLVSNGNNVSSRASPTMKARQILKRDKRLRPVLVCCFARFASYDVKGRQVASGNGASCPWQQHHFNVKTWWLNFVAPYSADNRSMRLPNQSYQSHSAPSEILSTTLNRPRSIYLNIPHGSETFRTNFYISYIQVSFGCWEKKKNKKFPIFTRTPRSHVRILIYRTWPINTQWYRLLLYGSVSQGLGTTKFTNLIGWNGYWPRSRFSHLDRHLDR